MPIFGGLIGLPCLRSVGANRVRSSGHHDRVAFARILVEVQAGWNIFAAVNHELRRRLLELVIDARAILLGLSVEEIADSESNPARSANWSRLIQPPSDFTMP